MQQIIYVLYLYLPNRHIQIQYIDVFINSIWYCCPLVRKFYHLVNFFGLFLCLVLVESIRNMVVAIFLHQQQELEDKTSLAEKNASRVEKLLDYFCLHLNAGLFLLHFSRSLFCLLPALQTKWEHRRTFPQSSTTSKQNQQPDSCVKDMEADKEDDVAKICRAADMNGIKRRGFFFVTFLQL